MIKHKTQSKGAALLIFVLLFVVAGASLTFLLSRSIYSDLAHINQLATSKQALLAAESVAEDMALRHIFGTYAIDANESLTLGGVTAYATSTEDTVNDELSIASEATMRDSVRKSNILLTIGAGAAFNYGLQAGNGGIDLANSAGIVGNVYSNGPITGAGSSIIRGDAVSAGPTGYIFDIHATGSAWAHTIEDSLIDGELNVATPFDDISNTVTSGIRNHNEPDQPLTTFPYDDAQIEEWKDAVIDYGTTIASTDPECSSGEYTISSDDTIGYLKVECDLNISKSGPSTVVTLTGPIWVEGNLAFTQGPEIVVSPSVGKYSVQFVVDDESNRLTSSQIEVRNSTSFAGNGHPNSYVMLLSMNESASLGGPEIAIDVAQSSNGDVLVYAGSGLVDIGNGIDLKEVTAYQINVAQNSDVIYESGLANLLFTSGPGGSYNIADWTEQY